jgi:integrase
MSHRNTAGRSDQDGRRVSFKVRFWKTEVYQGAKRKTYTVRWAVDGHRCREPFITSTLASSFRAKLVGYANDGVPFDVESGLPMPMWREQEQRQRDAATPTWYEHCLAYVDKRWPESASKQRASVADALATVTPVLVRSQSGMPEAKLVRRALYSWSFNTNVRRAGPPPASLAPAIDWVTANSLRVDELADTDLMERALTALASKLDGTRAAPNTYRRKRPIFYAALRFAVRRGLLAAHPLTDERIEFKPGRSVVAVDPRTVPNPRQARALLAAVKRVTPSGPPLVAFFGCVYYCAMRPGEVAHLRADDFELPDPDDEDAWGTVYADKSAPTAGSAWTNNGRTREAGPLKHRPKGTVRPIPVPPPMVRLVREHIAEHAPRPGGRLFRSARGGELSESLYNRVWKQARTAALTKAQAASSLAARPYDLRHACVSTWLAAGIDPARIAEWAGHSVEVLLRTYTHCLDGGGDEGRARITRLLDGG